MKGNLATSIVLLIVAIIVFFAAIWGNNSTKTNVSPATEAAIENIQKTLTPYDAKENQKKIVLVEHFKNSSKDHQADAWFTENLLVKGTISDGYLYVKGSVNGSALSKDDDIYVKLTQIVEGAYSEFGGHLIGSQSLETPTNASSTELLFDLSSVRYKKSFADSNREVTSGNWLDVLNNAGNRTLIGFTSTTRTGDIEELSFYYECLPETDCEIIKQ